MIGYAPDGEYLSINPQGKDWHIRLTRTDKAPCNEFSLCHGMDLTPDSIHQFVLNYDSLTWQSSRKGVGRCQVITANNGEFRVALITPEDCDLADDQIINEFRQFMSNAEPDRYSPL